MEGGLLSRLLTSLLPNSQKFSFTNAGIISFGGLIYPRFLLHFASLKTKK